MPLWISGEARNRPVTDSCTAMSSTGALCDEAPAFASCAGTDINHVVRAPDRVFVMLHDKKRVALLRQMIHGVQQNAVIFRMQTDCRSSST